VVWAQPFIPGLAEFITAWLRSDVNYLVPEPTLDYKIRAKNQDFINL